MISPVMGEGAMASSRIAQIRWNAVCDESRMYGVGRGKSWR